MLHPARHRNVVPTNIRWLSIHECIKDADVEHAGIGQGLYARQVDMMDIHFINRTPLDRIAGNPRAVNGADRGQEFATVAAKANNAERTASEAKASTNIPRLPERTSSLQQTIRRRLQLDVESPAGDKVFTVVDKATNEVIRRLPFAYGALDTAGLTQAGAAIDDEA
ncbi:MAG: hypothetical protein H6978_08470 [Gammaproteobacteria bacterium]|nr:hypothetical protein [Gammaproteobacteria bacterium]